MALRIDFLACINEPDDTAAAVEENAMSRLLEFYRGRRSENQGRFLTELWTWSDERLEEVHDFIQWMFPLPEPSQFNCNAPLLTVEDIAAFRIEENLQTNLRRSFERILTFLGLTLAEGGGVMEGPNSTARAADVWAVPNHNWLRITRILRSLRLLGLEAEAQALYDRLNTMNRSQKYPIPATTFKFWTDAVQGTLFQT